MDINRSLVNIQGEGLSKPESQIEHWLTPQFNPGVLESEQTTTREGQVAGVSDSSEAICLRVG